MNTCVHGPPAPDSCTILCVLARVVVLVLSVCRASERLRRWITQVEEKFAEVEEKFAAAQGPMLTPCWYSSVSVHAWIESKGWLWAFERMHA